MADGKRAEMIECAMVGDLICEWCSVGQCDDVRVNTLPQNGLFDCVAFLNIYDADTV